MNSFTSFKNIEEIKLGIYYHKEYILITYNCTEL